MNKNTEEKNTSTISKIINEGREEKEKLYVKVTAEKVYKRKILTKILLIIVIILLLFLSGVYAVLYVVNETGNFTIALDENLKASRNIYVSKYKDFKETQDILSASYVEAMDNITESWLPQDIDGEYEGSHNGENYIAYTFYVKNCGEESETYEASVSILSVIKNVDEAVRIAVYTNGEKKVYAKEAKNTGEAEEGTIKFVSNHMVMRQERLDIKPGEIDKYTIVIWLEGNDPECVDDILGGEMKLEMNIHESGMAI
jgi:hypothetical protein